jgi:hypothetical protein
MDPHTATTAHKLRGIYRLKVLKLKSSKDSKDNSKRLIARANIEQIQPGDYLV